MNTTVASPPRISIQKDARELYRATLALQGTVNSSGIDPLLHELVKIRASFLNGCSYCIDMHTREARALGESERRLYAVAVWPESPLFTDAERAALALTDSVTQISSGGVSDDVYAEAAEHFDSPQLAALLYAIAAINVWNRLAISTHSVFAAPEDD